MLYEVIEHDGRRRWNGQREHRSTKKLIVGVQAGQVHKQSFLLHSETNCSGRNMPQVWSVEMGSVSLAYTHHIYLVMSTIGLGHYKAFGKLDFVLSCASI